MERYVYYIQPIARTFAFCLMPNHFHFLLKIKTVEELLTPQGFENHEGLCKKISHRFGSFFNSYTKSFNKYYSRKGKLFEPEFQRRLVEDDDYFRKLVHYIHYNPVHHHLVKDLRDWKFSWYQAFFSEKATKLSKEEAIRYFTDLKGFINFHQQDIDFDVGFDMDIL